jgi:hypothetical protein
MKYDYFVAGRTRNKAAILEVVAEIRAAGKTAYCFIENAYDADGITFDPSIENSDAEMKAFEEIDDWQNNPTLQKIFDDDMNALKESENFVIVFPAGLSAHMELGAAYGLGKRCYAIGDQEKVESLYLMLDRIYESAEELVQKHVGVQA